MSILSKLSEQKKVVVYSLKALDEKINKTIIRVIALPGTGKTTTLKKASDAMLKKISSSKSNEARGIYLAYNNSIAEEARGKFDKSITTKTVNAFGLEVIRKQFPRMNCRQLKNLKVIDVKNSYNVDFKTAKEIQQLFNDYCKDTQTNINTFLFENGASTSYQNYVKDIWLKMCNGDVSMTHDFYLKLFANCLIDKTIKLESYDFLLFDEAQDANPIALQIFYAIDAKVKIIAGDKHQKIYSFNKSVNALLQAGKELNTFEISCYLTLTYRFEEEIGKKANKILKFFKGEHNIIKCAKRVKDSEVNTEAKTRVFISRTNASLVGEMIKCLAKEEVFITVRHPDSIFTTVEDVCFLIKGETAKIKDYQIKQNKTLEDLKTFATETSDVNLSGAIKIAEKYTDDISVLKECATRYHEDKSYRDQNPMFFTTAHTSKGLQFNEVTIGSDFQDFAMTIHKIGFKSYEEFIDNIAKSNHSAIDEFNLFFVALTRAIDVVHVKSMNNKYLSMEKEMDVANEVNCRLSEYSKIKGKRKRWVRHSS